MLAAAEQPARGRGAARIWTTSNGAVLESLMSKAALASRSEQELGKDDPRGGFHSNHPHGDDDDYDDDDGEEDDHDDGHADSQNNLEGSAMKPKLGWR